MPEVAKLWATVGADTRDAETGFARVNASIGGFATAAATALAGTALAIGAAGVASANSAAGFEQTMSGVKAVSGATNAEMQRLSGLALQLGKDTSFSASEAAAGIEELVKGGLSITDVLGGAAKSTLALAAAGGVSLPAAATIAANALAQFGLKGGDMAHVANLIAGAANASALDVGQFSYSLQMAGAVAATTGFKFDDLAQAIAVMGKAGITGSDAGTSLKTMMLNLQPSTDKARAVMKDLGLWTERTGSAFFDSTGKVKSMTEVAGLLQGATKNLTNAQRLQALETIFGSDAIRAAAVFAKEGAGGFREMAGAMGKVTAESVGMERLNNFRGDWEQLKGSAETLAITFGTALLPGLRSATQWATGFVNSLIPLAERYGPQVAGVLGTISGLVGDVFSQGGDLGVLADDLRELGLVDIGGLVTATRAVAGGFREVVGAFNQGGLAGVFAAMPPLTARVAESLLGLATTFVQQVGPSVLAGAQSFGASVLSTILGVAPRIIAGLGSVLDTVLRFAADALPTIATSLVGWIDAFIAWIPQAAAGTGPGILDLAGHVAGRILETAGILGTALLKWGGQLVGWIAPQIPPLLAALGGLVADAAGWIVGQVPTVAAALASWGGALLAWVAPKIPPLLSALGGLLSDVGAWLVAQAPTVATYLLGWASAFVGWVGPQIPPLLAALGALALRLYGWITDTAAPAIVAKLREWGSAFVDWIGPIVGDLITEAGKLWFRLRDWIGETAPKVLAKLGEWGQSFVDWVNPKIGPLITEAGKLWDRLRSWIGETAPNVLTKLGEWGKAFVDWVSPKVQPLVDETNKLWGRLSDWIGETAPKVLAKLTEWATQFNAWVGPAVDDLLAKWPGQLNRFFDWIEEQAPKLVTELGRWAKAFVDWIGGETGGDAGAVGQMVQAAGKIANGIFTFIGTTTTTIGERLLAWGGAFVGWIAKDVLPQLPGELAKIGTALWEWITNTAGPRVFEATKSWGGQIVRGFAAGLVNVPTEMWNALKSAFSSSGAGGSVGGSYGGSSGVKATPLRGETVLAGPDGNGRFQYKTENGMVYVRDQGGWGNAGQTYAIGRGPKLPTEYFTPSTSGMFHFGGQRSGDTNVTLRIGDTTVQRLTAKTNTRNQQKGVRQWTPAAA